MTGDYLKQLQLTKQLEQKTKEAARNRKEAEEKTAEAERAIASAKPLEAPIAEAEKLLIESGQAMSQKDYKGAHSLAVKSIEAVQRAKKERVASILDSAEALVRIFDGQSGPPELVTLIEKSRTLATENDLDQAFEKAKSSWDAAEQYVNSRAGELLGKAQTLLLLGEGQGIVSESGKQAIARARGKLEAGNYKESAQDLKECLAMINGQLRGVFDSRAGAAKDLEELANELGADFKHATEILVKARNLWDKGDVEGAFVTLPMAETEARSSVKSRLGLQYDILKDRATKLKDLGADVSSVADDIAEGREAIRGEDLRNAAAIWRDASTRLRALESDQLLELMAGLRARILLANKVKVDTGKVLAKLELARQRMMSGEFPKAVDLVREGESLLEGELSGYREVEAELAKAKALISEATSFHARTTDARRLVEQSRQLVMNRDFKGAAAMLRQAQEETHASIQGALGGDIMRAEMRLTTGLKMGADIASESAGLEGVVRRVKAGEYAGLHQAIGDVIQRIEAKINDRVETTIQEVEALVASYQGPLDTASYKLSLSQARESLKAGNLERAYELAAGSADAIRRDEKGALDARIGEAKQLLVMLKEVGGASVTLSDKLAKAEDLRLEGNVSGSLKLVNEVTSFSRSMIEEEVARRAAQLSRQAAQARKNGVEVLQAERLSEDSVRSISKGNLKEALALVNEGEVSLDKLVTTHTQLYDRIIEISHLLREAEAQGMDISGPANLLLNAKLLFEQGNYEESRPATSKAFVETEKLVAPFVAPRRLGGIKDLLAVAKMMGFDAAVAEGKLDLAYSQLEKKDYTSTMAAIRDAERTTLDVLRSGATDEIAKAKETVAGMRSQGMDVSGPTQILAKAESLLTEKRVYDSIRALELAKNELDQALVLNQRTADMMERAQASVMDAQEFGVNTSGAMELMRQARNYFKLGRQGLASELAKKAADQATQLATEQVRDKLRKLELNYRHQDLAGPDLETAMHIKSDIEEGLEQRRFKEAAAYLRSLEEELEKVRKQKEMATTLLTQVAKRLADAKAKGQNTAGMETTLEQAESRLEEGAFYESYALTVKCGDDLKGQSELFARRSAELNDLERSVKELQGEVAANEVAEHVDRARKALAALDYESANLNIRRGKSLAQEAIAQARKVGTAEIHSYEKLLDELKIERSSYPHAAKAILEGKQGAKTVDLIALREAGGALRQLCDETIRVRVKKLEASMAAATKDGTDVSASQDLLEKGTSALMAGELESALESIGDAEQHIGVAQDQEKEYRALRESLEKKIANAKRNGLELTDAIAAYRGAEESKVSDHASALARLRKAHEAADAAATEFLPDIQVDIDFLSELKEGEWTKASLRFANVGKALAREVCVRVNGDLETKETICLPKLRAGGKATVELEVMAKRKGEGKGVLSLECRPVLSNEPVGFDTEFEVHAQ
ncbi:MAG TPA: hypothetical protein VMB46_02100 [Methanomassiliicoccales archaeon]|nr:hypothetical protein [Methanomassiliicoccales archaeon]